ncbi:hypothetical protein [Curvibacter delicatus]|uniref:hypothetical protein n=1 Tax=Curvibacter delicatus TaxID=80879 RepID=UPI0012EE0FDF|nr:hypothetical protein [Curvibacter delicatus]
MNPFVAQKDTTSAHADRIKSLWLCQMLVGKFAYASLSTLTACRSNQTTAQGEQSPGRACSFSLGFKQELKEMLETTQHTLKAIEGYLANKADKGDEVATGLHKLLKPLLNPRQLISELRSEGYAVVLFSPDELGTATAKSLENRLVELGNEAITDLQESISSESRKG